MSDSDAYDAFKAVRFAETEGKPVCPRCKPACLAICEIKPRRIFKCKLCTHQFSLTSDTIFKNRKLCHRDILLAIAMFVNGAHGYPALKFSRDLNVSYKTAFVLLHKLRETMSEIQHAVTLTGKIEGDGVWVGGHRRKENLIADQQARAQEERERRRRAREEERRRKGRRDTSPPDVDDAMPLDKNPSKRKCIVTFRERRIGGRSRAFVLRREHLAVKLVDQTVDPGAKLITDAGAHWAQLDLNFEREEVKHNVGYMVNRVHINGVESFHSRIRAAERGVHIHISGRHVQNYADEMTWRNDHRRVSNGQQYIGLARKALSRALTPKWVGYWQKRPKPLVA